MASNQDATESANRSLLMFAIIAALAAGFVAYRWMHPATVFASDGRGDRWDEAVERSKVTHTPSLVLFTADWCPACRALHEEVLSRQDVSDEIDTHYNWATVDVTNPSLIARQRSMKYGVSGIPTLIRFDADGKETDRTHYLPPEMMMAWLRKGENQ